MAPVSEDLRSREAPLEYWFIKLHAGELAFLVDWIVRRERKLAEVRVSLWVRGEGRVATAKADSWHCSTAVVIGDSALDSSRSSGAVDDIEWQLDHEVLAGRATPSLPGISRLHPFDLELVSRPCVLFTGYVTVAGVRFAVASQRGSMTHYWGRRLPRRWRWISADSFGDTDLTVEAVTMNTRLWGSRPNVTVGYLWTQHGGRDEILISPATGLITVAGPINDYTLTARRLGRTTRLHCSAAPERYNDLGEGIHQTLHGSCSLVEQGLTDPSSGLEHRVEDGSSLTT